MATSDRPQISTTLTDVTRRQRLIVREPTRVAAPIDLEPANELCPNAAWHAGTARVAELWWEQIWLCVHSTPMLEAFGHGYGFDLFGLAPEKFRPGQEDWEVRTPHSVLSTYKAGSGLIPEIAPILGSWYERCGSAGRRVRAAARAMRHLRCGGSEREPVATSCDHDALRTLAARIEEGLKNIG